MAFRSALSLGINLRFVDDRTDSAAKEARSRLWWSIFSLEHYIACLTGRVSFATERLSSLPLPIPYEEEDFGKPDVVHLFEDLKLRRRYLKPTLYQTDLEAHAHGEWLNERDPCPSLFFNCVIDLVYIVQAVINKVYSIEGVRERSRQIEKRIRKYAIKMDNWLAKVPSAYQFTSVGGDFRPTDDKFAREKFKLAIHYYSSKITLYRPCLSHTDTHFNTTSQTSARSESLSESTQKGNSGSHSGSGDVGEKEGEKGTGRGVKDNRRTRFRTEMSLSCLRASCALISLVPDEPDLIYLSTISPWWEHLHCLTQATTALLLGLSNWPTSLPAEEKRSSSATATEPNMPFGPRGHATVLGSSAPGSSIHGEEGGEEFNANPNTAVPPLDVATVVANTKKALRWIFHIAVAGHDTAACRAFVLCVGFMKQIAPTVGIDVSDLPEVEALASIRDEKEHTTPSVQGGVSVGVGAAHAGTGADVHEAPGPGPGEGGAGGMQSESEGEDEGMGTGMRMNEHEMENAQDMVDDTWSGSGTGSEEWGYWGGE